MGAESFPLRPIGRVSSSLTDLADAPNQGDEGAPDAWIEFEDDIQVALRDLHVGDEVLILTWLDRADRDVLEVHPRGDAGRPLTGVFATRSPDRPNPIGIHPVKVLAIEKGRMLVSNIEALDGTPVIDVKPILGSIATR